MWSPICCWHRHLRRFQTSHYVTAQSLSNIYGHWNQCAPALCCVSDPSAMSAAEHATCIACMSKICIRMKVVGTDLLLNKQIILLTMAFTWNTGTSTLISYRAPSVRKYWWERGRWCSWCPPSSPRLGSRRPLSIRGYGWHRLGLKLHPDRN